MLLVVKQVYLKFLEKERRNIFGKIIFALLYLLSLIYGLVIIIRNFLYDFKILPIYKSYAKVISIGNISWSGSGKTPLSIWLYRRLSSVYKIAILRRGYGGDEKKVLSEITKDVFSSPDRKRLVKNLESSFNIFILDDGFQHRRVKRDVDIVIMGAREFRKKFRLIPAYFFREPVSSLKRSDILLISHSNEIESLDQVEERIRRVAPNLKIYFSQYRFKRIIDLDGNIISLDTLKNKDIAAFAAIGYPEGFFLKLKEVGLNVKNKIVYPDHYELSKAKFRNLEKDLIRKGIKDLVITSKDRYHLPVIETKLNIFIMEIEVEIENESDFLQEIEMKISRK